MTFPAISPRNQVFLAFYLYAVQLGGIFPRIAELQLKMDVGEGALGLGLLGFALGTQVTLMLGNRWVERLGPRLVLLLGIPVLGLAAILAALSPGIPAFFASLVFGGIAIGAVEIVVNVEADRTELLLGRRIMSRAHAFWSFGFFTAGFIGSVAAQARISPLLHLTGLWVAVSIISWVVLWRYKPAPLRNTGAETVPRFVRPNLGILTLVAFTLSAMLLEGAGTDWSVIYMRDLFDQSAFINGMAFSAGALAQAITRYFADTVVDRFGPYATARFFILVLGLGTVTVVFSPMPGLSLLGFALIGAGTSVLFPLAMSAAAQRTDRPAAVNVASVAQLSFIVFLLAPPSLGFIAEHIGIRYSFAVGLPLVLLSWFAAHSLVKPNQTKF